MLVFLEEVELPILYWPKYSTIGLNSKEILYLSQAVAWHMEHANDGGWYCKSTDDWKARTALTESEQRTAKNKLLEMRLLFIHREGIPCKTFNKVNVYHLDSLLSEARRNA